MSKNEESHQKINTMPAGINAPLYQPDIAATDMISDTVEEMMDEIEEEFVDHKKEE
ncbi:hypothetical protein [Paenibacillus sp. UNC451MF]|uniref:hypothetical protein n=1 Tax=Paenibacillus sp. UNC451MF TaxID=1449063 RepID=UPI000AFD8AA1|nr:hypothetical protein [Paenibacillus sp. UNC451MF]